jgi:hypothetical protein
VNCSKGFNEKSQFSRGPKHGQEIRQTGRGIRNRNLGIRRVRVADLEDHPDNFRTHPSMQADALAPSVSSAGGFDSRPSTAAKTLISPSRASRPTGSCSLI